MNKVHRITFILLMISGAAFAATPVSMVKLMVDPETYENKKVVVNGFRAGSPNFLFLTKDHALMRDSSSALLLNFENYAIDDECTIGYVKVYGKIIFAVGEVYIDEITRIYSHESGRFCERQTGLTK